MEHDREKKFKELEESIKIRVPSGARIIRDIEKDKFEFKCRSCGDCCTSNAAEEILLSPYDLYTMANGLNISIKDVIDNYCDYYIGESSNFVIVRLDTLNNRCRFLKNNKCSIHNCKPSICRLYPLGRMISFDTKTNDKEFVYFLINQHCGGKGNHYLVDEWVPDRINSEKVFLQQADLVTTLHNTMKYDEIQKNNKMLNTVLNKYYSALMTVYYTQYDLELPFFEQYNENIKEVIDLTNKTKMILNMINKKEV